ncbi:type III secretion inner membrane ring lipoprotein SctJ [Rhizobium sp. TRM95111]|uniref:type III secretion system inner membrane ring lipoprotein SctJ n=1 Tax=Rhizobium alarense TaxID=2846851 RepID=UPI001F200738|nr:type III secretion inner membrane ring lipoprotein SctJ [Rhizobium alarense]MCF3641599.1 type III secretion inner membrane ring lipoprotein SctJ [Rhizobium alarense]
MSSSFLTGAGMLRRPLAPLLFVVLLSGCSENVLSALDQRDARDAQVVLERAGITVTVLPEEDSTFAIAVDGKDHVRAVELLAEAGLPRQTRSTVADLFPGDGFLVTPFEQKARMTFAVEQQLAETLSALDGIASARVHVVLPEDNGRGLVKEKARASALLQYRPGADLPDIDMKSRAILLNSIRGLAYEDVSVVASPWAEIGSPRQAAGIAVEPKAAASLAGEQGTRPGFLSHPRILTIAGAVVLALAASLLLLAPRRKESR